MVAAPDAILRVTLALLLEFKSLCVPAIVAIRFESACGTEMVKVVVPPPKENKFGLAVSEQVGGGGGVTRTNKGLLSHG